MSRLSIIFINVATGIVVARTLGPAGRGATAAITLWPAVMAGMITLGVPAAVRYRIRREPEKTSEFFPTALLISGALGIVALIGGFALVPHVLAKYPSAVVAFAQLMMLFVPLVLVNATLQAFYDSQGNFKRSNKMMYVPAVLTLIGLAGLCAFHRISPYSVALAYEVPYAFMTVTTLFALRRFLRFPQNVRERVQSLLHYGLRAYGIDVLNTLAGQIDQAMVVGLLSAANFGLYAVAVSGARILSVPASSLITVLFPKASGLEGADAVDLVIRSARIVFALTAVATVAMVIALPVLISLAYGKEYISIVGVTRWLTLAVLFAATTGTLSQAFMATGRPGIATALQCVGVVLTAPLMLALIPRFGINGAAYAADISSSVRFALIMLFFPVFLRHPMPNLLLTRQDIGMLFGRLRRTVPV